MVGADALQARARSMRRRSRSRAESLGLERTLVEKLCEGAFDAVKAGDAETHDRIVSEGLAVELIRISASSSVPSISDSGSA